MTDLRTTAPAFDLKRLDAGFLDDPFPTYRALREHDPVHPMPVGSYFLSRYDDCAAVYRDPATWSSDKTVDFRPNLGESLLYEHHTTSLVFNDPPYHTRVRKLLAPAFKNTAKPWTAAPSDLGVGRVLHAAPLVARRTSGRRSVYIGLRRGSALVPLGGAARDGAAAGGSPPAALRDRWETTWAV